MSGRVSIACRRRRAPALTAIGALVLGLSCPPAATAQTTAIPSQGAASMEELHQRAEAGHATAEFDLGWSYGHGQGVQQDHVQAVVWYRRAANQGDANAQSNLGLAYANGQGVPQNYTEAATWFRKAAEQGLAGAQYNLGLAFSSGQGVPQDDTQAAKWFRSATRALDAQSSRLLYKGRASRRMTRWPWRGPAAAEQGRNAQCPPRSGISQRASRMMTRRPWRGSKAAIRRHGADHTGGVQRTRRHRTLSKPSGTTAALGRAIST